MERRLKERLIGAAILVVLIVLVAPELLSGPKRNPQPAPPSPLLGEVRSEPTRTVTVDLDTKRTLAPEGPAEPAASASNVAPPASTESAASLPATPPPVAATVFPPVVAPVTSVPAVIENHAAAVHAWTLQLGVFANRANAEQLVRTLKSHNPPAYLAKSGSGQSERWRVKVGPLADRNAADRMLAKLKSEGHAASLVAP